MRMLATGLLLMALAGCSFLEAIAERGSGPQLNPNKIYLGSSVMTDLRSRDEMDRYACVNGPMLCEARGIGFDCKCMR